MRSIIDAINMFKFDAETLEHKIKNFDGTLKDFKALSGQLECTYVTISTLEKQLNNGWIPIKDEEPPLCKRILITDGDGVTIGTYDATGTFCDSHEYIKATHWQPLPEPPKECE